MRNSQNRQLTQLFARFQQTHTLHQWPGNVRELANAIEHATILCDRFPIRPMHLPQRFTTEQSAAPRTFVAGRPLSMREIEIQAIHCALERNEGSKPKAAEDLGISLKTLYNRLNQAEDLEKSA